MADTEDQFLTPEQKREKLLSGMTPTQRDRYQAQRSRYFKGTIAVCVIYGTLALGLFLIALMSERGRSILAEDLLPFTMTFIGGMLFVIIVLTIQVINFNPPKYDQEDPASMMCPDYWKLTATPKAMVDAAPSADRFKMAYMCRNINADVLGGKAAQSIPSLDPTNPDRALEPLTKVAATMYPTAGSRALNCNYVYPELMSVADKKEFPDTPNLLRCKYAKLCGAPWTAACPAQA